MEKLSFPKITAPSTASCTEYIQSRADYWNSLPGDLKGYDCSECKNKGFIAVIEDGYEIKRSCKCLKTRDTLKRIHESGLSNLLKTCTFQNFETTEPFQEHIKRNAIDFVKKKSGCFIICGQTGCGKTHICTAVVGGLIKQGLSARYLVWREDSAKLKSRINESDYYEMIEPYKQTDVLYIDDLFKTKDISDISSADVKLAFELIDYRYRNNMITIISTEWTMQQLRQIDEAIAGRINQMSKGYQFVINEDQKKNYRLRK
jgi:DNA replication protein DnaC